tara:strand:+ start:152 stop:625 length:474 start_codon:yes stop_codon:yes gene_type:complete
MTDDTQFKPPNIGDIRLGTQIGNITINKEFVDETGTTCVYQQNIPLYLGALYTMFVPDNRPDPNQNSAGTCADIFPMQNTIHVNKSGTETETQDGEERVAKITYVPIDSTNSLGLTAERINPDKEVNVSVKKTNMYVFIAICIVILLAIGYFMTRRN